MKNYSIWLDKLKDINYPKLNKDLNVDILIVGGGISGISALYNLRNANKNVVLVEQNKIGRGITCRSTGKLTFLQNDLIDKIRKNFDDETAFKYIKSQKKAIDLMMSTIVSENISCDLEKTTSSIYASTDKQVDKLKDLEVFLNKYGINTKKANTELVDSKYMFSCDDTYLINPLKFIYGMVKNYNFSIYENTSIKKIEKTNDGYICYTDSNKIYAKKVIIASFYPYFTIPYLFPIKVSLEKSYISASKYNIKNTSLISYSNPFISIRNYKNYLIYLSNSRSLNTHVNDKENYEELLNKLDNLKLKPSYLWSNIDIMPRDSLPFIGEIKDNLYIATGYNTWGLTNGFLSGKILSDIIMNKENEFISLFNPKRRNIPGIIETFNIIYKNITSYIKGYKKYDNISYGKINGKEVMTYDDGNVKHTVYRRCPHLGCKLLFNEVEKTWDCPCHASRFDLNGNLFVAQVIEI